MAGWKHARKTTQNLNHCRRFLCRYLINPLNAELDPIRHLLALVGARHIVHVSWIRVKRPLQYEAGVLTCQLRSDDG
jgi:hypothetical protein